MKTASYPKKIKSIIEKLDVGQELDKKQLIRSIWNNYDYHISRSFDVAYLNDKRLIAADCNQKKIIPMVFKMKNGKIVRTE